MPNITKAVAGFIKGFGAAVFALILLAALAFHMPREAVQAHVAASEKDMGAFRRADTFTECLVLGAALIKEESLAHGLLDFKKFASDPCDGLNAALRGAPPPNESYMRYWNGSVVLARFVFAALDYMAAYGLYLFLSAFALGFWGYALFKNGVPKQMAGLIPFSLLWFGGFVFYGGNMAHAPAFFMPFLVLAGFTLWARWWERPESRITVAAALGVVTLYFDMLFGAIPFILTALLLTTLLCDKENNLRKTMSYTLVFLAAGSLTFALKIFSLSALKGFDVVWADITNQLSLRMGAALAGGEKVSYASLLFEQLPKAAEKIYGHPFLLLALMGGAFLSLLLAVWRMRFCALPLLLAVMVVPLWYALFMNHSWVHSGFACRLLVWPILLGFLALALARENPRAKLSSTLTGT